MRVGVVATRAYPDLPGLLAQLERIGGALGIELAFARELAPVVGDGRASLSERLEGVECLLTLGGDGTLLRGARLAGPRGIPLLGCNLGHLGFLTTAPVESLEEVLQRLAAGDLVEDRRLALDVKVVRARASGPAGSSRSAPPAATEAAAGPRDAAGPRPAAAAPEAADRRPADTPEAGEPPSRAEDGGAHAAAYYALNDAVVHKSGFARLVTMRVWVDGDEVGQYSADGIVISTATGSTAYSLSAGGPILVPTLDALVATPICPHTLAVRPLVVSAESAVTVEVVTHSDGIVLTVDGQVGSSLALGDRIRAARSPHPVRLLRFPGQHFFSVLRQKLRWGDVRPSGQ